MDPSLNSKTWFYRNFLGDSCGPYSAEKMLAWYKDGHFSGDLMVKRTTSSTFFRLSSSQCFTQLVFDLEPKQAKIEDTDMNEEYVEKEIKQESSATLLNDTWQESPVLPVHKKAKMEIGEGFFKSRRGLRIKLRDRRSSGIGSAKLEVKEEYIEKEFDLEPKPAKIEDTDMNEEYVEKEIKQESSATLLNDTWQESPVPSVYKKAKMEIFEGFFKSKIEGTDMNEEYVEKEIKQESSATLLNDTWQESPVPPVHKKAKMEIGEGFFKSRRGLQIKLRDRRSSGNGSAKLEVKEEYKDKEIKAESPHSFAKELEEYREYRNRIKQTNYWKFEKKSDNSRGFGQYYVMCTACPLALKDDSIEQMIEICEFPRHVRKVHGRKGLSWMNSAKGARGCKVCGASQVIVKNIKKHKKCIDRL